MFGVLANRYSSRCARPDATLGMPNPDPAVAAGQYAGGFFPPRWRCLRSVVLNLPVNAFGGADISSLISGAAGMAMDIKGNRRILRVGPDHRRRPGDAGRQGVGR